jgi:tetratricopeptide (TPR) repeat protein
MRKPETKSNSAPVSARSRFPVWLLAVLLGLVTIALYWPAMRCDFIGFDDPDYVTANLHVQGGLNWAGVKWAFCNTEQAAYWAPMMWLSHMLGCQLFGLNPWGHHLINVLLHAANTVLVFLLFRRMTGAQWRSVMMAALFGWHPLRVESVAWVTERKDVLSAFFGLLSLLFYVGYARRVTGGGWRVTRAKEGATTSDMSRVTRYASLFYWLALLFFALGLMSKAMLVTWPFVMLLLDWWPLQRVSSFKFSVSSPGPMRPSTLTSDQSRAGPRLSTLVIEKFPFFGLAAAAGVVTYLVQKHGGALTPMETLPLGMRVGNALISYCRYLGMLFWPADLAVFYPHPGQWPLVKVLLAAGLMTGITVLCIVRRRRHPFMLMGWLWYVGTLVPVIQLVQSGNQMMADRFTYIPSLGMLILVIWGAYELSRRWQHQMMMLSVAGCVVIILCLGLTRQQLGYWKDSETLFEHALEVTKNNYLAHKTLGDALLEKGRTDEAIRQFHEAIRFYPDYADAHYNLGNALDKTGQTDEAIRQYQEAIRLNPDYTEAHNNLGNVLDKNGQTDEAIHQYQDAIRLKADFAEAHNNLGTVLLKKDQIAEAIGQFQETIRLKPDFAEAHNNLGNALNVKSQITEAINQYRNAIHLKPDYQDAHLNLALALQRQGKADEAMAELQKLLQANPSFAKAHNDLATLLSQQGKTASAIAQYREALRLDPDFADAANDLAWLRATCPDPAWRDGPEAVRLAERAVQLSGKTVDAALLDTLAAALAEAGRFDEAVQTAGRAQELALASQQPQLAEKIARRQDLYRQNLPYRSGSN